MEAGGNYFMKTTYTTQRHPAGHLEITAIVSEYYSVRINTSLYPAAELPAVEARAEQTAEQGAQMTLYTDRRKEMYAAIHELFCVMPHEYEKLATARRTVLDAARMQPRNIDPEDLLHWSKLQTEVAELRDIIRLLLAGDKDAAQKAHAAIKSTGW